jgi:hypothetical protein
VEHGDFERLAGKLAARVQRLGLIAHGLIARRRRDASPLKSKHDQCIGLNFLNWLLFNPDVHVAPL